MKTRLFDCFLKKVDFLTQTNCIELQIPKKNTKQERKESAPPA